MYLLLVADLATDDLGSVWKNVNMFTDTDEYKQLSNRFFFCFFFFLLSTPLILAPRSIGY